MDIAKQDSAENKIENQLKQQNLIEQHPPTVESQTSKADQSKDSLKPIDNKSK